MYLMYLCSLIVFGKFHELEVICHHGNMMWLSLSVIYFLYKVFDDKKADSLKELWQWSKSLKQLPPKQSYKPNYNLVNNSITLLWMKN